MFNARLAASVDGQLFRCSAISTRLSLNGRDGSSSGSSVENAHPCTQSPQQNVTVCDHADHLIVFNNRQSANILRGARSSRDERQLSRFRIGVVSSANAAGPSGLRLCDGRVFEPQAGACDL